MKQLLGILLIATLLVSGCGCSQNSDSNNKIAAKTTAFSQATQEQVVIPDLTNTDEESAKTLLLNLGLVPIIKTKYSDTVDADLICKCKPKCGASVEKGSKVVVYKSVGPQGIFTNSASVKFNTCSEHDSKTNISFSCDDLYIYRNQIFISFIWHSYIETWFNSTELSLNATLDDTTTTNCDVSLESDYAPLESDVYVNVCIPLSKNIDNKTPNTIEFEIPCENAAGLGLSYGGKLRIKFYGISWS